MDNNFPNGVFSDELQCFWLRWEVADESTLRLYLPSGSCCDMTGAISIAGRLLPAVAVVETYAGGEPDTQYRRCGDRWQSWRGGFLRGGA